jgi:hypothetical protein
MPRLCAAGTAGSPDAIIVSPTLSVAEYPNVSARSQRVNNAIPLTMKLFLNQDIQYIF